MGDQQGAVYKEQGGDKLVIGAGGSLVQTITKQITRGAKVGGTAGWVVGAADDKASMARLPASQSAATLVVPLSDLPVGATITGMSINGQIESAGNAATLDMSLRSQTVAAADLTDAAVTGAAIAQVSVTADTAVAASDTFTGVVVAANVGYYLLITGTTAAATDIDLVGVSVTYTTA